jgi:serine/threonine protein kinase
MQASLIGQTIDGWHIDKAHGFGKSAVVMGGAKEGTRGAVKVFHPELIELFGRDVQLERIRREKSLIGFTHPNLVTILDGGECHTTSHLYVAMEELSWGNLRENLDGVPAAYFRQIISQLAEAARALEGRGLAHRDIKPENIAISPDFKRIKLLDLGVLRPAGVSTLTDVNARPFIGTLRYSSPEYLQRLEEDSTEGWRALTIYQIGAVLHDLLMRRELFSAESEPFSALVQAVLTSVPSVHNEDAELARLCKYCLVKSPATRLKLVSWNDLLFKADASAVSAENLRSTIEARQTYSRALAKSDGIVGGERNRLLKQKLEASCGTLSLKLAVLLADACFPLHSVTQHVDREDKQSTCVTALEPSDVLGMPSPIEARLRLTLIDENGGHDIYRLDGSAAIKGTEGQIISSEIAVGDVSAVTDVRLEAWLLEVLAAAYDAVDQG